MLKFLALIVCGALCLGAMAPPVKASNDLINAEVSTQAPVNDLINMTLTAAPSRHAEHGSHPVAHGAAHFAVGAIRVLSHPVKAFKAWREKRKSKRGGC